MDKQNDMAQLRYLEEMAISLKRAGFETGRIEDHHLPVNWNGSYLCRISGKGSVLYRQQNVDANGAQAELRSREVSGTGQQRQEPSGRSF